MARLDVRSERGAVLVFTALAMLVLVGFLVLVIDQGVLLVARAQAQNAADAGALAGATALMFDPPDAILQTAQRTAESNPVWDDSGAVVVELRCPDDYVIPFDVCVRVDVHRDGAMGSAPIPTVFGPVLNITEQHVRATATAHVAAGNAVECLRPFAIRGALESYGAPADVGQTVTLVESLVDWMGGPLVNGAEFEVLNLGVGFDLTTSVQACVTGTHFVGQAVSASEEVGFEPALANGIQALIDLDPAAVVENGRVVSPCVMAGTCEQYVPDGGAPVADPTRSISPRVIPVAVVADGLSAHSREVVNIIGFFVEGTTPAPNFSITGALVRYPGQLLAPGAARLVPPEYGFVQVARLLR